MILEKGLKALANPTRLRVLELLKAPGTLSRSLIHRVEERAYYVVSLPRSRS